MTQRRSVIETEAWAKPFEFMREFIRNIFSTEAPYDASVSLIVMFNQIISSGL